MNETDLIDRAIGGRIRFRRQLLGMTLAKAAASLEDPVSLQQFAKYETGETRITAARLAQVAEALQCPVGYFFDEFGLSNELPDETRKLLSEPLVYQAMELLFSLSNKQRHSLISLMAAMRVEDTGEPEVTIGNIVPFKH